MKLLQALTFSLLLGSQDSNIKTTEKPKMSFEEKEKLILQTLDSSIQETKYLQQQKIKKSKPKKP